MNFPFYPLTPLPETNGLFASAIFSFFSAVEQYFSLTIIQPEQCFQLLFSCSEQALKEMAQTSNQNFFFLGV